MMTVLVDNGSDGGGGENGNDNDGDSDVADGEDGSKDGERMVVLMMV